MPKSLNCQSYISNKKAHIASRLFVVISIISIILIWLYKEMSTITLCEKEEVDLIVLITSAAFYHEKRSVIRNTWLKPQSLSNISISMKHFFVVGKVWNRKHEIEKVEKEIDEFGDILLLDVDDNLKYLTEKILESLWWTNKHFNSKYILKCDDDSYVRMDKFSDALIQIENVFLNGNLSRTTDNIDINHYISYNIQKNSYDNQQMGLYWGYFSGFASPIKYGPYAEFNWIACDNYIPYAFGGGYVLSKSIVKYLSENRDSLRYYVAEDVSIGIWLSSVNDIVRIHDIRFDSEYKSCSCQNYYIVMHSLEPENIANIYKTLQQTGRPCVAEHKKLYSAEYRYNWGILPSKCCVRKYILV